jgi:pimeloyl-ACP methyl ester carboxylesterase
MGPDPTRRYSGDLANEDATFTKVLARLNELQQERQSLDPVAFCRKFWSTLRPLYVVDPADADRLGWEPCDLPNEVAFMKPFTEHILPSIQRLHLTENDFARVHAPVLVVHGRKDRSAAYGGGRDWAIKLPDARLVTLDHAAHVPWIEAPNVVFEAIDMFLNRRWPATAETLTA